MKTLTYTTVLVLLLLGGVAHAQFTSSVVYSGTMPEYLHRLDLFENYGNKEKLIDAEEHLVKFSHEHKDGTLTERVFKLDIVGPTEDIIEFHVTFQREEDLEDDDSSVAIDFDEAVISFIGFPLPRSHPLARRWGHRLTYNFDARDQDDQTKVRSPVRFSFEHDTEELKRIDIMSIYQTAEGFVGKIKPIEPEESWDVKSMSLRKRLKLVNELLEKHGIPAPQTSDVLETEEHKILHPTLN
ncbi:MAG: hypothetical protein F4227_08500 [Gammaproteobacteria bacterium]|nr:hypothetical protein [Gammaproteobacteria bacterium]MYF02990.1 hypothetical protein [Gammaproteobacteria bacterium]MYI76973.1 hypothetical protein [Gammaproteobacteria bacterium]